MKHLIRKYNGFHNTIKFIIKFRYKNVVISFVKYFIWLCIKLFNIFPRDVRYSNSIIHFQNKHIANQGGTKLYCLGVYDYDNMHFSKDYLRLYSGVFFDIGANIGIYSIFISELSNVKVIAFEPHPITYEYLLNNIHINDRKNIMSFNIAVGDNENLIKFIDVPGSSVNKVVDEEITTYSKYILVEQKKLSNIIEQIKLIPDVIKIDTEGYELNILKGLDKFLSEVKLLILEISNYENEINQLLTRNFNGPLYIDYKNKLIKTERYYSEDPVSINKSFIDEIIHKLNFQLI